METMRIGVIGVGVMGSLFARLASEHPSCELAGIADTMEERARLLGTALRVPHYRDYRELLDSTELGAVVIATSDECHLQPALDAASRGKHIFIEKPLATTSEDGQRIADAAASAGIKLMVGHTLRFDQHYGAAYRAVRSGDLGEVIHLCARRNCSRADAQRIAGRVGVTMFLGIHSVDIIQWIVGSSAIEVTSIARRKVMSQFGVDDTVLSLLRFGNGVIGTLENSWIRPNGAAPRKIGSSLTLMGTKGAFSIEAMTPGCFLYQDQRAEPFLPAYTFEQTVFGNIANVYRDEFAHFVDCIRRDRCPIITPAQALSAVKVCEAIEQSVKTGHPVSIEQGNPYL